MGLDKFIEFYKQNYYPRLHPTVYTMKFETRMYFQCIHIWDDPGNVKGIVRGLVQANGHRYNSKARMRIQFYQDRIKKINGRVAFRKEVANG